MDALNLFASDIATTQCSFDLVISKIMNMFFREGDDMTEMFIYHNLNQENKDLIDEEIESYIINTMINNESYHISSEQFDALINEIVIYGKDLNNIIGDSVNYFSLKHNIVEMRAKIILLHLKHNRPNKELVELYISLCKENMIYPITDLLFDKTIASRIVENLISTGKKTSPCNNKMDKNNYKSNFITYYERLFKRLYEIE